MATLTVPYSFNTNTAIIASEMNSNFGAIKTFVEALAAGTNIDTGVITSEKLATNTVQLLTPTGSVTQYAGSAAPTGWLFCDGAEVSRTTYAALFAVVGTTFGSGNGSSTFNLPDLKGRVPVGKAVTGTFANLAATGGAETHTLTTAQIPSHQHNISSYAHSVTQSNALTTHNHTDGSLTVSSSGGHTHGVSDPQHRHTEVSSATGTVTTAYTTGTNNYTATGSVEVYTSYSTTGISITSTGSDHAHDVSGSTGDTDLSHGHSVGVADHAAKLSDATGGGTSFNILQPYIVMNYIIKI